MDFDRARSEALESIERSVPVGWPEREELRNFVLSADKYGTSAEALLVLGRSVERALYIRFVWEWARTESAKLEHGLEYVRALLELRLHPDAQGLLLTKRAVELARQLPPAKPTNRPSDWTGMVRVELREAKIPERYVRSVLRVIRERPHRKSVEGPLHKALPALAKVSIK